MLYIVVVVAAAVVTARSTKLFPRTQARIGLVSAVGGVVAFGIGLPFANFFLVFLGALALFFGLLLLLAWIAASVQRDESQRFLK